MVGIGAAIALCAIQSNRAADVLAKSQTILGGATTVVGSFTQRVPGGVGKADFNLKKDRKLAILSDSVDELCDGKFQMSFDKKSGTYTVKDVRVYDLVYLPGFEAFTKTEKPNGTNHETWSLMEKFANGKTSNSNGSELKDLKVTRLDGKEVVSYVLAGTQVYLDPATALPVGADFMNGTQKVEMRFSNVRLNENLDDSIFTRKVGTEFKAIEQGTLTIGSRVPSADREAMKMIDGYMKGKKHTVIAFFSEKSAADSDTLTVLDRMVRKAPKNVAILAVAQTANWRKVFKGLPPYPVVIDAPLPSQSAANQFGVTKYPTIFIIDENRTVEHVQIGTNEEQLMPALAKIGFAKP